MKKLILLSALYGAFFGINTIKAQDADTKKSFLTTGVSISIPKEHSITVYGGVSTSPEHTQIAMVMPNIKINKYISFMPLYVFLKSPQAHSKEAKEHQVNAMLTFSLPLDKQGKWILQNRNTYLHRFIVGGEDFDFYRGRLGIVHRAKIFDKSVNFFAHDEIFIDLKKGDFARNRVYLGADIKLFNWLNPQFFYIYQSHKNHASPNNHLFIIAAIIPLGNHGFFGAKK